MKIKIIFKAEKNLFPLSYRMMITSLIKNALEKYDSEYFKELYYYEEKKNKRIKPFTFSVFFKDYKIEGNMVNLYGSGSIILSTCDYNFGISFYNGLHKLKEYTYKEFKITLEKITLEKEKKISESRIFCKTLSPIYVKDKNNKAVDINDVNFNKELNYICNLLLENVRGEGLREQLYLTPVKMRKVIAKEKLTDFKKLNNKDYLYIEGYKGSFYLEGDIQDLRLLLESGIGFRRSEGFGMIDIV